MTERLNPVSLSLDVQRHGLEQARRIARANVALQRRLVHGMTRSLEEQRAAERAATDLLDRTVRLPLIAARSSVPDADEELTEVEAWLDESLAAWGELREETRPVLDEVVTDWVSTYDDWARRYADLLDASFDAALATNDRVAEAAERTGGFGGRGIPVEIEEEES